MNKLSKKLFSIFTSLVLVAGVSVPRISANAEVQQPSTTITIFHTNDMHGRLLDASKSGVLTQIGADYTAAIKKSVPDSLLIDAGDATQGLPFASISKGADVIALMNAAGYDGMVLGNHEFDYGKAQALANAALAKFPMVSANTLDNGKPLLAGINGNNGQDFIKTVNGVKIGFFGITTQETVYKTNPSNLPGITFEDPIATSKTEVAKLKSEGAKVIVGIMHIGNDASSSPISEDIAKAVDGINVIIDGHSHSVENKIVNATLIAQTACYSANIGRIDITVAGDGTISSTENLIPASKVTGISKDPDATVKALADKINESQQPIFKNIVGFTNSTLWGGTVNGQSVARLGETSMGDLIADSMIYGAKSQVTGTEYSLLPIVALENGGGVRDSILPGYINQGQVTTVLPFGNILSLKVVTPSILYKAMENGVSSIVLKDGKISGADGRFPQISGMRFEYNPALPKLSRVTKIVLTNPDGSDKQVLNPTDNTTEIVLASNDYEIGGGDGYNMLGSLKNIGEGGALDVLCSQYITKLTKDNGGIFSYPNNQNRCTITTGYDFKPYTASITVNKDSSPLANAAVKYSIDGGKSIQAVTDANGILTIANIPSGAHTIRVTNNNLLAFTYINDMIGLNTSDKIAVTVATNDQASAAEVFAKINALSSNPTLADKDAIAAARKAYDELTDSQKALVTNYSKLTQVETAFAKLSTESSQTSNLSQTGSIANIDSLLGLSVLMLLAGTALLAHKKKDTN